MELIDKVKDKIDDKDLQIELLEDITDSVAPSEEMIAKSEYDKLVVELDLMKKKYADLQDKYISRFGNSETVIPNEVEIPAEEEEKEVIDVKEIFDTEEEKEKEE